MSMIAPRRVPLRELIEKDLIKTNEGRDTTNMAVVDTSSMQLDRATPGKTNHFDVWLTIDGQHVKDSNLSICAASPAEGMFVLYEIEGLRINFPKVNGCHVVTYEKGYVEADTRIKFYGLKQKPRRCITFDDRWYSRALLVWHTKPYAPPPEEHAKEEELDLRVE